MYPYQRHSLEIGIANYFGHNSWDTFSQEYDTMEIQKEFDSPKSGAKFTRTGKNNIFYAVIVTGQTKQIKDFICTVSLNFVKKLDGSDGNSTYIFIKAPEIISGYINVLEYDDEFITYRI